MSLVEEFSKYLCPAGEGVFTVNTAKERREEVQTLIYSNPADANKNWLGQLKNLKEDGGPFILGLASDCGGGILRGANWGPLFVRKSFYPILNNQKVQDLGDVRVIPHLLHDKYLNKETISNCRKALYKNEKEDLPVSPLSIAEKSVETLFKTFPKAKFFGIGGDHSGSYAFVKPYLEAKKAQGKKVAIIHFDAHTDLLVERLGIDICFGSWCPHILPYLDSPDLLIQLGIRSSGKSEQHWESTFGVQQYWTDEIKKRGIQEVGDEILKFLKDSKIDELYVSFDIDALDESYASATGTPEKAGLAPHEAIGIIKMLGSEISITGADLMEVAPFLNTNPQIKPEPDITLQSASQVTLCLLELMGRF